MGCREILHQNSVKVQSQSWVGDGLRASPITTLFELLTQNIKKMDENATLMGS